MRPALDEVPDTEERSREASDASAVSARSRVRKHPCETRPDEPSRTNATALPHHPPDRELMRRAGIEGPQACPRGLRHAFSVAAVTASVPLALLRGYPRGPCTGLFAGGGEILR